MRRIATCQSLLGSFQRPQMMLPMAQFSTYFKELDKASRQQMGWNFYKVGEYEKMDKMWRAPLAKKELRKARREQREESKEPIQAESEILYVHNAEVGVTLPARPD